MSRLPPGRYWPAASFWHERGPLVKLIFLLCLVAAAVGARTLPALALLVLTAAVLWRTAYLPGRLLLGVLRSFSWLILLTLTANLLLVQDAAGRLLWPPHFTQAGALAAGINALRLLVLFALGAWLTGTTTPLALTGAAGSLLRPLRKARLPVGDLTLVMGLGLRLLPDLLEGGGRIRLAQQARGVGGGRGWRERWHGAEALALSLFALAFRRADELALAMEARGYRPGSGLWPARRSSFGWRDLAVLAGGFGLVLIATWLGRL